MNLICFFCRAMYMSCSLHYLKLKMDACSILLKVGKWEFNDHNCIRLFFGSRLVGSELVFNWNSIKGKGWMLTGTEDILANVQWIQRNPLFDIVNLRCFSLLENVYICMYKGGNDNIANLLRIVRTKNAPYSGLLWNVKIQIVIY